MNNPRFARLQQSLQQGFSLDPKVIFKEAWARINGAKLPLLLAALGMVGFTIAGSLLLTALTSEGEAAQVTIVTTLFNFVFVVLIAVLNTALELMGVHRAVNKPIRATQIFDCFTFMLPIAMAYLLMLIGMAVLVVVTTALGLPLMASMGLVGILMISMSFSFLLIVDKGLKPLAAILTSMRLFARQWWQLLLIYLLSTLLVIVAAFSFGILLIWAIPLYITIKGIVYREACGVEGPSSNEALISTPSLNTSKDKFEA